MWRAKKATSEACRSTITTLTWWYQECSCTRWGRSTGKGRWRRWQRKPEWWVKWWECWIHVGSESCGTYVFMCRSTCADSKSWKWRTFGSPSGSPLLWSVAISFRFRSPVSTSLGPVRSGSNGTANFTYLHFFFFW